MTHNLLNFLVIAVGLGCGGSNQPNPGSNSDTDSGTQNNSDSQGSQDSSDSGADPCADNASEEIAANAEWLILDGASEVTYSLAQGVLSNEWVGSYGTYDLNTVETAGGNGFKLERPGTVVGVSVRWDNITQDDQAATIQVWPDFGSDGYMWDLENPTTDATRCLNESDEGAWIDYALEDPIVVDQPLHVFAGYHRTEADDVPEILFEDTWVESEPYHAGIRFVGVDDELYHLGMASTWYTWQVRLAVVYEDEIADENKPFQVDDALTASSRVAWGDYDNDGDDDLMTNGPALYENNGDGTFTSVTSEIVTYETSSSGGVWGDFNNDGCLDYFGQGTSYTAGDLLLENSCNENDDGVYLLTDVTTASGIADLTDERDCDGNDEEEYSPTEGSAWFDVDGDGFLDLYAANYECSSDYDYFKNYDDRLWRNNGDGTFTDWSDVAGIPTSNQAGRGATTGDYDQDGDTDLFVSNYRLDANFFLENNADGTVSDIAGTNGTKGEYVSGAYGHTIGAVFGDIDNDGDFDMVHANLAHPFYYWFSDRTQVLINDGTGIFTDEADDRGIYYRETHSNPTLFDADNDGDLDLFITCVYSERDSDFYTNEGDGVFVLSNYESGLLVQNGWGAAVADFDNDGDVDMLAGGALYRNDGASLSNHLKVRAIGIGPEHGGGNVSAIGAVITVTDGTSVMLRDVSGGSGTGVQNSLTQHFGLGSIGSVDQVSVLFPGGTTVNVDDVDANQTIWIREDGTWLVGEEWPDWDTL